ncbi:MAG: hypothetical protein GF364_16930, partial [Candidatus Lokiarchaeota archaeon]|nr:hypothetical protein [Candidatus Lokiarchaeota archaeon]
MRKITWYNGEVNEITKYCYDGDSLISYEYDVLSRAVSIKDQNDYEVQYTYTADNQKKTIKVYNPSEQLIYSVQYDYDQAGRVISVNEPALGANDRIAAFEYDENGSRSSLTYYLENSADGNTITIDYQYNNDNVLTGYETTTAGFTGLAFELNDVNVDGLGRVADINEILMKTDSSAESVVS